MMPSFLSIHSPWFLSDEGGRNFCAVQKITPRTTMSTPSDSPADTIHDRTYGEILIFKQDIYPFQELCKHRAILDFPSRSVVARSSSNDLFILV
jgi:hypothetical protein